MVSLKELQKFIQDLAKSEIVKLELKTEELELKVQFKQEVKQEDSKTEKIVIPQLPAMPMPATPPAPQPQAQPAEAPVQEAKKEAKQEKAEDEDLLVIKAPMVGTFYRRPAPDKPPYVEVGDYVKPGQVVCIIEAMKLFNEIESEVEGTIVKVLVEDATPVEYDQPLFLVKPPK